MSEGGKLSWRQELTEGLGTGLQVGIVIGATLGSGLLVVFGFAWLAMRLFMPEI